MPYILYSFVREWSIRYGTQCNKDYILDRFLKQCVIIILMYNTSFSVPHAIKQILSANPLYLGALKEGIANYTALAQKIKPTIEEMIGAEINLGTIVVAIKRIADTLSEKESLQFKKVSFNGIRMSLTGSIIDVDFNSKEVEYIINTMDEIIDKEIVFNIFQTDKQLRLFAEDIDEIRNLLSAKSTSTIKSGLSKITIKIPNANAHEIYNNLLSTTSTILNANNIYIYNAFFSPDEIVIILDNKDAARAYELLRSKLL